MLSCFIQFADIVLLNFKIQQFDIIITASFIINWAIALLVGILTRLIVGKRLPFGVFGTIVVALFGIWVATEVIVILIPGDLTLYQVPLLKAAIGALCFEIIWYLITFRSYQVWARRRQKYSKSS